MGKPLAPYLQFPPKTPDVPHAPFSLPVFLGLTVLILAATVPLLLRLISFRRKGRSPEARPAVPVVGMDRRRPGRGVLDPRVEPDPVDGRFPGTHVHTPVDRLHPGGERVHGAEDGPVPDALPDPSLPPPLPGQRGVLVVLRVPQPLRRKLALRRRDGIRGGGIFPLRDPPVLHHPPGGPFDPRTAALLSAFRGRVPRMAPPLSGPAPPRASRGWGTPDGCCQGGNTSSAPPGYLRCRKNGGHKAGSDRPRRAVPLLRGARNRRDRPRRRLPPGLGRPAHAPDLPRRASWRTTHAFRNRLRRLARRRVLRPRRPPLRFLLGNVEFRELREVGVRHPLRRRPARLRDASPRVCRATCRSECCAPESGTSSSASSAWNRKRFPFHNGCDKIDSRRKPPFIPTSQEGVR